MHYDVDPSLFTPRQQGCGLASTRELSHLYVIGFGVVSEIVVTEQIRRVVGRALLRVNDKPLGVC